MSISRSNSENSGIFFHRHHRFHLALSLFIIIIALLGFLSAVLEFIRIKNFMNGTLIGSAIAIGFGIFLLFDIFNTLLIISSKGIEYRRGGYTLKASWQDIDKIEVRLRRGMEHVLILKKSTIIGSRMARYLLQISGGNLVIPLSVFERDWYKMEIGELINYYAPHTNRPG